MGIDLPVLTGRGGGELRAAIRTRVFVASALLLATSGCTYGESWVRRAHAYQAESDLKRNRCEAAWDNLDYAQATRKVSLDFDASTALLRARCLDRVGRRLEAEAYHRFIASEYSDTPVAKAASAAAPPLRPPAAACPASHGLHTDEVFYYRGAQSVKLGGRARVRVTFDAPAAIGQIEIVDATHPLIAAMALQSAAGSVLDPVQPDAGEALAFPCAKELHFNYQVSR
jgi:hypothetical protein